VGWGGGFKGGGVEGVNMGEQQNKITLKGGLTEKGKLSLRLASDYPTF